MLRHGARHDIYLNPQTGLRQPVPRHSEIQVNRHIGSFFRFLFLYLHTRGISIALLIQSLDPR